MSDDRKITPQEATRALEEDLECRMGWPPGTGQALRLATSETFGRGDLIHERALNIDAILRITDHNPNDGILSPLVVALARHTHLAMEDAVRRVLIALGPLVGDQERP